MNYHFQRGLGATHRNTKRLWGIMTMESASNRNYLAEREWLYQTYDGRCWMCEGPASQIDHIVPRSRGGSDQRSNLRLACSACNVSRNRVQSPFGYAAIPPVEQFEMGRRVYEQVTLHRSMYKATEYLSDAASPTEVLETLKATDPVAAQRLIGAIESGRARAVAANVEALQRCRSLWRNWEAEPSRELFVPHYGKYCQLDDLVDYVFVSMSYDQDPPERMVIHARILLEVQSYLAQDKPWETFPSRKAHARNPKSSLSLGVLTDIPSQSSPFKYVNSLREHTILLARHYLNMSDAEILERGFQVSDMRSIHNLLSTVGPARRVATRLRSLWS